MTKGFDEEATEKKPSKPAAADANLSDRSSSSPSPDIKNDSKADPKQTSKPAFLIKKDLKPATAKKTDWDLDDELDRKSVV